MVLCNAFLADRLLPMGHEEFAVVLDVLEDFGIISDALQCMTVNCNCNLQSVPAYMQCHPAFATSSITSSSAFMDIKSDWDMMCRKSTYLQVHLELENLEQNEMLQKSSMP